MSMLERQPEIKLDGTYPYDMAGTWELVTHLTRENAARLLGVKHFNEHDNGFLNKGFKIVQHSSLVSLPHVIAVYHHDSKFSLIKSSDQKVCAAAREKYGAPIMPIESFQDEEECPNCGIARRVNDPCTHCTL